MIKFSKTKYPTKQTINLATQEIDYIKLRKFIVGTMVCTVGLACFIKFGILDRVARANEIKSIYLEKEQEIQLIEKSMEQYGELQELYNRLNNTFLSESEKRAIDRIEMLNMIEQCVLKHANVDSIKINDNRITVNVIQTTLTDVSDIVADLETQPETAYVTVFTAQTNQSGQADGKISADIMVQLKIEEERHE